MKKIFYIGVLLYIILLGGCTTPPLEAEQQTEIIPVHVEKVKKDTFIHTLELSGLTKAKQEFPIFSPSPMLIEEVYTKLGQKVNKGDKLILFANPELDAQLQIAEQQVALMEQALKQVQNTYPEILENHEHILQQYSEVTERAQAIVNATQSGAVTMLDLLEASTQLLLIQNQLQVMGSLNLPNLQQEQLTLQQNQAQQQLHALQRAKEQLLIRAPFNGIITMQNISTNELAVPNTPLLLLSNIDQIIVQLNVSATQIQLLKEGAKTMVWFEGLSNPVAAPLQAISISSSVPGSTPQAQIILDNPELNLSPGHFVKVEVETEHVADALLVPIQAVSFSQQEAFVYIVNNNLAKRRPITLGQRNNQYYHVISGIDIEDVVITQGQERVLDGSNVYIQK